ncbi:MAG: STAS domain-containing protein [Bacteroidota bacterium]
MNDYYSFETQNGVQILKVNDLLSEFTNKDLLNNATKKIEAGQNNIIVDLSAIDYMNSVGINLIIQLERQTKAANGKMVLVNPSEKVGQLLKITKLWPLLCIENSIEEGIKKIQE